MKLFHLIVAVAVLALFSATATAQYATTLPNTWSTNSTPSTLPWYCGSTPKISTLRASPFVAENGSYFGQRNSNFVPKTVYVGGYCRTNGTYVRGHYRSAPNTNPR